MTIVDASSQTQIVVHDSKSGGISTKSGSLIYTKQNTYTQGSGNNQIGIQFNDERTLSAGANEVLDFSGTMLQDDFGNNIALTKIKELLIENESLTGTLSVGGGTSNLVLDVDHATVTNVIQPGGRMHIVNPLAGWTVTATTGDLLKITNGDGSNATTYKIVVLGI